MTEICFVRHGETDWNLRGITQGSTDIPLNETGFHQAATVAGYLARERWHAVYASPLQRAFQTGHVIAQKIGIESITQMPELVERHFGEAEGMLTELRRHTYRDGRQPLGAESWDQVVERMLRAAATIAQRHAGQRVVAVSHGGAINGLLGHVSNGEIGPGKTILANTAMNLLRHEKGGWRVIWFNRTAAGA